MRRMTLDVTRTLAVWAGASLLLTLSASWASGQQPPIPPGESTDGENAQLPAKMSGETADQKVDSHSLENPRATMLLFVTAMERSDYESAATALDYSELDPSISAYERVRYASLLKTCIDRVALFNPAELSDASVGPDVTIPPGSKLHQIQIGRGEDGQWRFTAKTVASLPTLFEILKDAPPPGDTPSKTKPAENTAPEEPPAPEDDSEKKAASSEKPANEVPERLRSARRTMRTLFEAIEDKDYPMAVDTLDWRSDEDSPAELGQFTKLSRATHLKEIIERMAVIDYGNISDDPSAPPFHFPPGEGHQPIVIERDDSGAWRFNSGTVARIDALYGLYQNKPILNLSEEQRPWYMQEIFEGNEVWRILALFAAIFVSMFVGQFVRMLARWRAVHVKQRDRIMSTIVLETIAKTITGIALLIGLKIGVELLVLDFEIQSLAVTVIRVLFVLIVGYICYRLVDVVVAFLNDMAIKSGSTLNDMLVPIVRNSLRLTVIVLVVLEIATAVSDQPPSAVIASLGAGGLAIGLAAQDTIKNVFGSMMIFADRPFELGDRIVIDGHDGPVESVGFRSTRIRTLDGHLVAVPNGEMSNRTILNIGKRPFIRRVVNIRLAYDTPPDTIRLSLQILRELLDQHQGMKEDFPPRVFLHDFLDDAVNVRAIYWYHPPNYWDYCDFGEQLNLRIMDRFRDEGIRFALPEQRLFVQDASEDEPPSTESPQEA